MSYADYDHAGWVEANIAAMRRIAPKGGRRRLNKDGDPVGWDAAPEKLSPFRARVVHILGLSLGGIYNAPIVWNSVNWGLKCDGWEFMSVPIASQVGLATWDFNRLTTLVFACHQARVRLMIGPHGVGGMILRFSRRNATSSFSEGHPNLEEALAAFREYVSADHPITYVEPEPQ